MPLLTELKIFLIFVSTNMSRLRRWIFQNSFSIHNCAFIGFAISTAIMYLIKQAI